MLHERIEAQWEEAPWIQTWRRTRRRTERGEAATTTATTMLAGRAGRRRPEQCSADIRWRHLLLYVTQILGLPIGNDLRSETLPEQWREISPSTETSLDRDTGDLPAHPYKSLSRLKFGSKTEETSSRDSQTPAKKAAFKCIDPVFLVIFQQIVCHPYHHSKHNIWSVSNAHSAWSPPCPRRWHCVQCLCRLHLTPKPQLDSTSFSSLMESHLWQLPRLTTLCRDLLL